jgi:hypothetical protein
LLTLRQLAIASLFVPLLSTAATFDASSVSAGSAIQSATVNTLSQASTNLGVTFAPYTNTSFASGSAASSVDSVTMTPKGSITTGNVNASASGQYTNAVATTIFTVNSLSIVPIIGASTPLTTFNITAP